MEEQHTTSTAEPPKGGFPPFDTRTFPSQLFWLTVTFVFLFVVLWRFIGPRIQATIGDRRAQITADVHRAEVSRRKAEEATVAYETPLSQARERARALNSEYRERAAAEMHEAKAQAEMQAAGALADTEARLAGVRTQARAHISDAARDAAVDIVERLTGERVAAEVAAAAVQAAQEA
jgi:F-type H+-transporting ATPase subunit b